MENLEYLRVIDVAKDKKMFQKAFVVVQKQALSSRSEALSRIAYCYGDGIFLPMNAEKELYYYLEAYKKSGEYYLLDNIMLIFKARGDIKGASYFGRAALKKS